MRNRMANDMMEAVNLTHRVERAVLEQKLEDAEQNLAIRDLKLDWMSFKTVYGRDDLDSNDHVADPALTGQYKQNSKLVSWYVAAIFSLYFEQTQIL